MLAALVDDIPLADGVPWVLARMDVEIRVMAQMSRSTCAWELGFAATKRRRSATTSATE
jgi:hypothetical protein